MYQDPDNMGGWLSDAGKFIYRKSGEAKDAIADAAHDAYVDLKAYWYKDVRFVDSPSFAKVVTYGGNYLISVKCNASIVAEWYGLLDVADVAGAVYSDYWQDPPPTDTSLGRLFANKLKVVAPGWAPIALEKCNEAAFYVYSQLKGQTLFPAKEISLTKLMLPLKMGVGGLGGMILYEYLIKRAKEQVEGVSVLDPATWQDRAAERKAKQDAIDADIQQTADAVTKEKYAKFKESYQAQLTKWQAFQKSVQQNLQYKLTTEQMAAKKKELEEQQATLQKLESYMAEDLKQAQGKVDQRNTLIRAVTIGALGVAAAFILYQALKD